MTDKITALYCRLSQDDMLHGESERCIVIHAPDKSNGYLTQQIDIHIALILQ